MTVFWITVIAVTMWTLGRAQLRAELSSKELERRNRHEETTVWDCRRYYR